LQAADSACYVAKDAGRNRIHVYHEHDAQLARRHGEMQWVSRIQQALEDDGFQLYTQLIEHMQSNAATGLHCEVLLRLVDETGRVTLPGVFVPAAEHYDLAVRIDRWVIDHVFRWLAEQPNVVDSLELCTINLSGHSLSDRLFEAHILRQFEATGIPGEKIGFEITETAAIANLNDATRFIKTLKTHGCRFALDDFGSGLSSFAYLKNLPVDFLKIDGMFVKDMVDDPIDLAMVRSINEIGQLMGKQTIAEYVENDAIRNQLRELGVNLVQGFGVSRPQPIAHLMKETERYSQVKARSRTPIE
ncbi:MAG: EAL domain-containing protein, partial [Pseudomonadales bacterium]